MKTDTIARLDSSAAKIAHRLVCDIQNGLHRISSVTRRRSSKRLPQRSRSRLIAGSLSRLSMAILTTSQRARSSLTILLRRWLTLLRPSMAWICEKKGV